MKNGRLDGRSSVWAFGVALVAVGIVLVGSGCGGASDTGSAAGSANESKNLGAGTDASSGGVFSQGTGADGGAMSPYDSATAGDPGPGGSGGVIGAMDEDNGIGLKPGGAQDINFFRLLVQKGDVPKSKDMTMEGWLNEHDTKLPPADPAKVITLHAHTGMLKTSAMPEPTVIVQLGLNAAKNLASFQDTVGVAVVIDRSGSMAGSKLEMVKAGLKELVANLPDKTQFTLLSFSNDVKTEWGPKSFDKAADVEPLTKVIAAIQSDAGTNFYAGLEAGLQAVAQTEVKPKFRRVVMLSDGQPTVGTTQESLILAMAKPYVAQDISISTVGVGSDYSTSLMVNLAQIGNGTAHFVNDFENAKTVFVEDLETMLTPVASNLTLAFELGEGFGFETLYGFDWVIGKDGLVQITGPKKPEEPAPTTGEDATSAPDTSSEDAGVAPPSIPKLFASKKNGLLIARLKAPKDMGVGNLLNLLVAKVHYGYDLDKDGSHHDDVAPVIVDSLMIGADGNLSYFTGDIVRRAFVVLEQGLAMIASTEAYWGGQTGAATGILDAAIELTEKENATLQDGALDAGQSLLEMLKANMLKVPVAPNDADAGSTDTKSNAPEVVGSGADAA